MYPHTYFDLYPPFPYERRVFVAMSFDDRFTPRYREVLEPAIRSVLVDGIPLEPHRVDSRLIGDSILTEILQGIGRDVLFLADITTIGHLDDQPVRSANVMYELGLAHAVRTAEQILAFRSDHDTLSFDVANIRVNSYSPDTDLPGAREQVTRALASAINELSLTQSLAVQRALRELDGRAVGLLVQAYSTGSLPVSDLRTLGQAVGNVDRQRAIDRLLQLGAIVAMWPTWNEGILNPAAETYFDRLVRYEVTPLGRAVVRQWVESSAANLTPEQRKALTDHHR